MNKWDLIAKGERALDSLYLARDEMGRAFGWGVVDLLGGGFFSTLFKRSKMNRAREYMERARYDLYEFAEAARYYGDISMDVGFLLSFGDYMDWFFAEVMVQVKIAQAKERLEETIDRVEHILYKLRNDRI